ncbi:MAG: 1-deoxy-D-xylulose-5-phosphate synthase [Deltaproteobacteria bacterium]|nr:1-deoxy-D-xylulose-5-phosphate synthase [Deltaproteobacteria bacterium]
MNYLHRINGPEDLQRLSVEQLPAVATELREFILEEISKIGGHLGAAMGVVELAVAVHYAFESPKDRVIWDVGHQAHAHKILTGRRDRFHTMKQEGGLSGFLKRSESPHDIFGAGHASTSISAALGIREGLRLKDNDGKVVAIIGDGALTGGMAFEALNNAGALKRDLIVVVNDNGMSISPNVGALSEWFSRKLYGGPMTRWRRRVRSFLEAFDRVGDDAIHVLEHLMDASKHVLLTPGVLFEGMGFEYIGPIDGHDTRALVETFRNARELGKPVVVHACTSKGKGCPDVDSDVERMHAVGPREASTSGKPKAPAAPSGPSYTAVFGETLCQLAETDPRVVAITAAMPQGTGLVEFAEKYPGRFYDVGIAEQHAVTFAAGLAVEGFRPVCAIYSSFLQRAFDQTVHDVCLQHLPVTFCMDRAGIVGADGPTHHGVFDISYLRMIPEMSLMAPKDEDELRHMLFTATQAHGPVAMRYPRGNGVGVPLEGPPKLLPWGKGEVLLDRGTDLLIIAAGTMTHVALEAAAELAKEQVGCTVINARFLKPLDEELLVKRIGRAKAVITIEENALAGGFGSAVLELCADHGLRPALQRLGIPDRWVEHGKPERLLASCGLSVDGVLQAYRRLTAGKRVVALADATN